jgi:ABC-type hemin transport system ATPase subunit
VLTRLSIRNFKGLGDVSFELGQTVVLVGPNNSGKTTALQALALWNAGLRKWMEKRSARGTPEKRPGVTINRRDLIAVPVPVANLLWRDLHVRAVERQNGKPLTRNICIEIAVSGVTNGVEWQCGFEFDYANQESFYCRPLRGSPTQPEVRLPVPDAASGMHVAFLTPMSGLAATEESLEPGAVNVRIGEGRTAGVLRNLCYRLSQQEEDSNWKTLVGQICSLFGVKLNEPVFLPERGQITMSYQERDGIELDLVSSGRGLQQTLLLLAHLYVNPNSVLLLDEPDAHLEILRQRQIYQLLTSTAERQGCQLIAASHSEVLLNEAADRDIVIAFVGAPHRINDRGSQVLKSLKSIGFEHYYQAELTGWVLYLEGSTDLAILQAFASMLNHPAAEFLNRPFVEYTGNVVTKARDHFFGLREAKPDLVGLALLDAPEDSSEDPAERRGPLREVRWRQREIENYLCFESTLLAYASSLDEPSGESLGPLFAPSLRETQLDAMRKAIDQVANAIRVLGRPDPFGPKIKASDDVLTPIFQYYFDTLQLPNLMQKTHFHALAKFVPLEEISPEIEEKLDLIVEVARSARPADPAPYSG